MFSKLRVIFVDAASYKFNHENDFCSFCLLELQMIDLCCQSIDPNTVYTDVLAYFLCLGSSYDYLVYE